MENEYDSGRPEPQGPIEEEAPPVILAEFARGQGEKLILSEKTFKGARYLDFRIYSAGHGQSIPTKRGITIKMRDVARVIEALSRVQTEPTPGAPPARPAPPSIMPAPLATSPARPQPPGTLPLGLGPPRPLQQHRTMPAGVYMNRTRR